MGTNSDSTSSKHTSRKHHPNARRTGSNTVILMESPDLVLDSHSRLNWKSLVTFMECSGPKQFVLANRRTSLVEHLSCLFLLIALCLFVAFVVWFVVVFLNSHKFVPPETEIFDFETEQDYAKLPPFPVIKTENPVQW